MRRSALFALGFGVLLLMVGVSIPLVYLEFAGASSGATGIIGGADGPTYSFLLFGLLDGLPFVLVLFGAALITSALFCLLLQTTVKAYCGVKTSIISLGLSAAGGLGLTCAFLWLSIVAFGNVDRYPIAYPASIAIGLGSFCAFVALIGLYLNERRQHWSWKGFVIDILTSILYLPAFFFGLSWIFALM
jgi:hypothetical protein